MKKKLVLILILVAICVIIIPIICYFLFHSDFKIIDYKEEISIPYGAKFDQNLEVCYGNFFNCYGVEIKIVGEVDTNKLDSYEVTYIISYNNKKKELKQIVNVKDETPPVIEVEESEFWYCPNKLVPDYKVKAIDNYDGDISDKVVKEVRNGQIIFTVIDSSGNKTELVKDALEKDDIKPIIELNGEEIVHLIVGSEYEELGATAYDNCDGNLNDKIEINGDLNINEPGEYKIDYKVKDKSNNESIVTRRIYVIKNNEIVTPPGKSIYLTFDDGPSMYTNELLDILKKYNVKATFFVTNQNLTYDYDDVILRAYQEGHAIGLHTSTHNYGYIYSNINNYFSDLYSVQSKVKSITGYTSTIIRFPGGSSNTVSRSYDGGTRIMSTLTNMVESRGFRYFDWNVVSGDAGETTDTSKVASNVINSLGSGSTYVVLQHDTKKFSIDATEEIIQYGLNNGYQFRTLSMNSPRVEHYVNN